MRNLSIEHVIACDGHFITFYKGKPKWTKKTDDAVIFSIQEANEFTAQHRDFFEGLKVQFPTVASLPVCFHSFK